MRTSCAKVAVISIDLLLTVVLANTGCASILSGSTQLVTITTNPDTARVEIVSHAGQVINRLTSPTSIELKRGRGFFQGADLSIRVSASGYGEKQVPIPTRLNGWYFGNLVFGGLIGMLIVDPITGGMYRFPDQVHIDLTDTASASVPPDDRAQLTRALLEETQRTRHLVRRE